MTLLGNIQFINSIITTITIYRHIKYHITMQFDDRIINLFYIINITYTIS